MRWFERKSLLFLGPANVSCGVDLCWYDAIVLTNNMATMLDELDLRGRCVDGVQMAAAVGEYLSHRRAIAAIALKARTPL